MMNLISQPTLTALELDPGQVVSFTLADGGVREIAVERTWAKVMFSTLTKPRIEVVGERLFYQFGCTLRVGGESHELVREVPTRRSFYEPWVFAGVRVWLDAVDDIFGQFLNDTHGAGGCRPSKRARLAVQDATLRICPELMHPWCPLRKRGLDIMDCYCGEDCWLGTYAGSSAHGGLDINHRRGTPIWAPIALDDHCMFNRIEDGHNNNRWRGWRRWSSEHQWIIQCHHMTRLTAPEHQPIAAGQQYADGAGVLSGYHDHSHFVFKVAGPASDGREVWLDPWILFWQMYQDKVGFPDQPRWR